MGYNWDSSFEQNYASTPNDTDAKRERDMLQAQLAQETMAKRNQIDTANSESDFEKQMQILQASNEYAQSNMEQRAKLEAQLIALQKGYLPPDMAKGLIGGDTSGINPVSGNGHGIIGAIADNAGSIGAMSTAFNKNAQALSQKGMTTAGNMMQRQKLSGLGVDAATSIFDKVNALPKNIATRGLGVAAKGGVLGATANDMAIKGAGKVLTGIGSKSLGKVAGAVVGGVPGLLIGTALGEIITKMLESDDEKERARAQYMMNTMQD